MTASTDHGVARRVLDFARSEMFERTYREGMALVEQTAAYLDGPGRAASKQLSRSAALAYAAESMRLTTRLMQVASWLLVQRAVREGEMGPDESRDAKYRLSGRSAPGEPGLEDGTELPEDLRTLTARAWALYERVQRLDATMYAADAQAEAANPVAQRLAMLQAALGGGPGEPPTS